MVSRRSGCLLLALLLCAPRISAAHTALERPFTLVDTNGRTISDKDLRGRWLLVFFGYTSCPDICPTTLSSITTVLKQLGSFATRVQPAFITVDPARDTPEALGTYLGSFDQRIIGLTGTDEQIARVAVVFGAQYFKVPYGDPKKYAIAHSALIYVIGPEGGIVTQFSNANDADDMARTLTALIK
jgi:protein SCO1/2